MLRKEVTRLTNHTPNMCHVHGLPQGNKTQTENAKNEEEIKKMAFQEESLRNVFQVFQSGKRALYRESYCCGILVPEKSSHLAASSL
jgi:hypothetical protein